MRQKAAEPREPSIFDQLTLASDQRERLDALLASVEKDFADYDVVRLQLLDEIVAEVRAGAFDHERLDPLIEKTIVEYERATPHVIRFANQVHRTLKPHQRQQLLDLWEDDDEDISEEERREKEEEDLTRILDLTGSQKTRLLTPLLGTYLEYYGPIGDSRKYWKEAKSAFGQSEFDAAKLRFFTALPIRALARAIFEASATVLAVLEPDQRETLAVMIETNWRD